MKIGCLQFAPQVGDIEYNLSRADLVLDRENVDQLDLLVLPEMAFSGYNFDSLAEITPCLEKGRSGISAHWARVAALKYDCYVVVGYPEDVDVTHKWPASPEHYNAALIMNWDGDIVANYRKSFLYVVDEKWALEGDDGFYDGKLEGLGRVAMGICMDINPYKFEAPWDAYEFAVHALRVRANLVILSMAWLTNDNPSQFFHLADEPDFDTINYWIRRLAPLIRAERDEETIVVFCNRSGVERNAVYAGSSAVVGIQRGEVKLYGVLARGVEKLLVVDTSKGPLAKFVETTPGDDDDAAAATATSSDTTGPPSS